MLVMKNCAIEPGDIIFVVSNSSNSWVRFKKAAQSLTTPGNKHGHMEVITVFVCTGKNKHGVICHNYELQLTLPTSLFIKNLREKTIEELTSLLVNYCNKEFTAGEIKKVLAEGPEWMKKLQAQITGNESTQELIEILLKDTGERKEKLMDLLVRFWQASGEADTLPIVNSSLLVFKHNDQNQRQQFLKGFLEQVETTKRLHAQGKTRTSWWAVIKSLFQWSNRQDEQDRKKIAPSDETFCSSNVMQVLNQVNPNLVNRGRYVLPKTLEAGLREATKSKKSKDEAGIEEPLDDFEDMIAAQEQLLPPFRLQILPATGKELMRTLLERVDTEITRIEAKRWFTQADREKARELKRLLIPFRDPKYQNYPIHLQVEVALKLICTLLPALKRKTGLLGELFPATSYTNIRAFARTQGIFDGDIREAMEKLQSQPLKDIDEGTQEEIIKSPQSLDTSQIYIFSDWSFSSWSASKRKLLLNHMNELLTVGHEVYLWKSGYLVKMDKMALKNAINGEDFDDLLSPQLKPATRTSLIEHAQQQQLDTTKLRFLDYRECRKLAGENESLETLLDHAAPLFSTQMDEYHVQQMKLEILDVEMANAQDEKEQFVMEELKKRITVLKDTKHKTYRSGMDTKACVNQSNYRKPVFKPVDFLTATPSVKYYRDEVYSELVIPENPTSPFHYFELGGMNATEKLVECDYDFHPEGLTEQLIKKRKTESKLVLMEGKKKVSLTENWRALPSLQPGETLLDIAIEGLKKEDFEIKYSKENHLYFIRLLKPIPESRDTFINLLLRMPQHYRVNPVFNTLITRPEHQQIHQLMLKYLSFGRDHGALRQTIDVTVHRGEEYLQEARKLSVGSCRLRAIAFKEEMKRLYPDVPVSIVINPDHCFIEMELDGQWQRYCLGGYRDTPGLLESVKEESLTSMNPDAKKHRFFIEKTKAPLPMGVPAEENRAVNRL
ncbi:hypothetical protein [Fluoribacter dumoffii]|uniref:hypothetical protein n=1 Tax=Fluoribacter dumoffii TaxID=463 RepID=UPI00026C76C2|nr:hypothetical protein [Fluoribacter dumoffii]